MRWMRTIIPWHWVAIVPVFVISLLADPDGQHSNPPLVLTQTKPLVQGLGSVVESDDAQLGKCPGSWTHSFTSEQASSQFASVLRSDVSLLFFPSEQQKNLFLTFTQWALVRHGCPVFLEAADAHKFPSSHSLVSINNKEVEKDGMGSRSYHNNEFQVLL